MPSSSPRTERCPVWDDVRVATGETLGGRFTVVDYLGPDGEGGQYLAYDMAHQRNVLIRVASDLRTAEVYAQSAVNARAGAPGIG